MHHPIARVALCIAMLAAGQAGLSRAHQPAKVRSCASFRYDGQPVGVVIEKAKRTCATAKKVLRTYGRSEAACGGSACVRKQLGWTYESATAADWPRLASCNRGKNVVAAYAPRGLSGRSGRRR
jgi:hypothetical protein